MKIQYMKFKGFNSYPSDKFTEINFNKVNGLILLYGNNGSGKTTISDVLKFNFYGRIRDVKPIKNIINRYGDGLETEVGVISKGKTIVIRRGLSPDLFEFTIDGVAENTFNYKLDKQEYLEQIIGFNYNIFENIISLSIGNFKSFTKSVSPSDKRGIIDKLFGVNIISEMFLFNREQIKKRKNKVKEIDNILYELYSIIDTTNKKIKEREIRNNESMSNKRDVLVNEINENKNVINEKRIELNELLTKRNNLQETLDSEKEKKYKIQSDINFINERLKLLKENDICSYCGSDLSGDKSNVQIGELGLKINEKSTKLSSIKEIIDILNNKIENINQIVVNVQNVINTTSNIILNNNNKLNELLKENDDSDDLLSIIDSTNKRLSDHKSEIDKLNKEIEVLTFVSSVLDEDGAKSIILSRIMPVFNKEVNETLDQIGIYFRININNKFDTNVRYAGKEIPINTLSAGQLKKIDLAIILTFIKILKTKFFDLNLIFIDEMFSNFDQISEVDILKVLRDIAYKYEINIMFVNHRDLPEEVFDYKIEVSMKNMTSDIDIKKI